MQPRESKTCPQCGAQVLDIDGPVHAYVPSSPGCWMTFGELQADEMQRFRYPPAHRLVVDAYMAQHPGDGTDRRDRQSVFAHLVGLYAVLEQGIPAERLSDVFRRVLRNVNDFPILRRSSGPGPVTVNHLVGARDLADYQQRAERWAGAVWQSWSAHHDIVRRAFATDTKP
ncbi:MAG: DUF5946 family protein [Solirubrobacteraceae bacterium]|jgi:hypothetical protein